MLFLLVLLMAGLLGNLLWVIFRVHQFAKMYAKKLKMNESVLRKTLWGDFYLDPKTKRVSQKKSRSLKPLFVQFVLENIWKVYDSIIIQPDAEKTLKIVEALGVKVTPKDLKTRDTRGLLRSVLGEWLPLAPTILISVIEKLPSPVDAQPIRMPLLLHSTPNSTDVTPIEQAIYSCKANDVPVVAYVSKMFDVNSRDMPENRRKILTAEEMRAIGRDKMIEMKTQQEEKEESPEEGEVLIGFSRIYSGVIKVGQKIKVLAPKYDPKSPDKNCIETTVKSLYMIMGKELEQLEEVPAGNVFGIGGLEGFILKTATISSTSDCPSLGSLRMIVIYFC